jgi:hypothetical protein
MKDEKDLNYPLYTSAEEQSKDLPEHLNDYNARDYLPDSFYIEVDKSIDPEDPDAITFRIYNKNPAYPNGVKADTCKSGLAFRISEKELMKNLDAFGENMGACMKALVRWMAIKWDTNQ